MESSSLTIQTDANELILSTDSRYICETYIFDPVTGEESLGRLFAVAETEDRDGIGTELIDLVIQSLQKEYYRDPSRGVLVSFESALHQANLVLHDTAESGVRDWMGYFHVAVGVLAGHDLHISTSGNAMVYLTRKASVINIAQDLAHSPITNPLRTFGQVASGSVQIRDVLFFATSHIDTVFSADDLRRFAIEHSAATIGTRLQQLYTDKQATVPLALLTVSLLPQHIAQAEVSKNVAWQPPQRAPRQLQSTLTPRRPLVINRSWFKTMLLFALRVIATAWRRFKTGIWPLILHGSNRGSRFVIHASKTSGRKVRAVTEQQWQRWRTPGAPISDVDGMSSSIPSAVTPRKIRLPQMSTLASLPVRIAAAAKNTARALPRSSKIFAGITVVLVAALAVSLLLLQQKRTADAEIQRASELLHDARTQVEAAETALIYDNREQARSLLTDAEKKTGDITEHGLYANEATELRTKITSIQDRLQRIVRATSESTRVVGDFASLAADHTPTMLAHVNGLLFTANPETNAILSMGEDGVTSQVTETTEGIGFVRNLSPQAADKSIVFATSTPGIALFDAKSNTLQNVEISLPSPNTTITSIATYGTRLYLYDSTSKNIYGFSKTLRGYSGGAPWITTTDFPKDNIKSIAVDGSIYTLHNDGSIRELLKGEPQAFTVDTVEPSLETASKIIKTEDTKNIYVLDTQHKRVIIFTTEGQLVRQLYLDFAQQLTDVALSPDEKTLYALDGTRVLAVSLAE